MTTTHTAARGPEPGHPVHGASSRPTGGEDPALRQAMDRTMEAWNRHAQAGVPGVAEEFGSL